MLTTIWFQRAELVVTNRLHTALPCSAYRTPVCVVKTGRAIPERFAGYDDKIWQIEEFDWDNPTVKLEPDYIEKLTENLRNEIKLFLEE